MSVKVLPCNIKKMKGKWTISKSQHIPIYNVCAIVYYHIDRWHQKGKNKTNKQTQKKQPRLNFKN